MDMSAHQWERDAEREWLEEMQEEYDEVEMEEARQTALEDEKELDNWLKEISETQKKGIEELKKPSPFLALRRSGKSEMTENHLLRKELEK